MKGCKMNDYGYDHIDEDPELNEKQNAIRLIASLIADMTASYAVSIVLNNFCPAGRIASVVYKIGAGCIGTYCGCKTFRWMESTIGEEFDAWNKAKRFRSVRKELNKSIEELATKKES